MNRITEWVVDHPRRVLISAISVTLAFACIVPFLKFEVDFKKFLSKSDPAVQALDRAEERYGSQEVLIVVIETADTIFKPSTLEKFKQLEERLEELAGVDDVQGPMNSQVITGTERELIIGKAAKEVPETAKEMAAFKERLYSSNRLSGVVVTEDGRAGAIMVWLKPKAPRIKMANQIRNLAKSYEGPERIYVSGLPAMHATMIASMLRDLYLLVPIVVVTVILILLASFRNRQPILLCMPVVGMSIVWTVGLMVLFGQKFTPFAIPLPVMLVAIGTANGIHILNRYYEETARGLPQKETILNTMEEMRGPVTMTSLTTAAGFLSLTSSLITAQRGFGIFIALGVLLAMVLSLILIPAMLTRFEPSEVRSHRVNLRLEAGLGRLSRAVSRGRIAVLLISLLVVIACALAVPRIKVETIPRQMLGEGSPTVIAMDVVGRYFGGSGQLGIEIDTRAREGLKDPQVLAGMVQLQEYLESLDYVHHPTSLADLVREMNQKLHADDPSYYAIPDDRGLIAQLLLLFSFQGGDLGQFSLADYSSGEVTARVQFKDTDQLARVIDRVQSYLDSSYNNGPTAEQVDILRAFISLFEKMPLSQALTLIISAAAAALIVMLLMQSIVAGLICIIPLLLTVLINFGIMAYSGMPLDMATLMVASIAIGVGIDYAIHLTARCRAEASGAGSLEEALVRTMRTEGKAISYNALVVALGFAVLLASSFRGMANVGMLISLTMVISALSTFTVIPAILVTWRPKFLWRKAWSQREVIFAGKEGPVPNTNPLEDPSSTANHLAQTDKEDNNEGSKV